ncbi:MAG: DUF4235 domain-containing protein [Candidatus Nanopelagicales bacterium]
MSALTARTIAPLAAMGATWAVRRGLASAYAQRTGHVPPQADDTEVSLSSVLLWAVTTAAISVTIEVVITRYAARYSDAHELASYQSENIVTG